jgi:hypothetical protein
MENCIWTQIAAAEVVGYFEEFCQLYKILIMQVRGGLASCKLWNESIETQVYSTREKA